MATILEGEHKYQERYVVEVDDVLYGPFDGQVQAMTFAFERFDPPFTLRVVLDSVPAVNSSPDEASPR